MTQVAHPSITVTDKPPSADTSPPEGRVLSIDALRGLDMFMIIGGNSLILAVSRLFADPLPKWYARQFEHEQWNGFTAHDLIMPLFLFIVGAAMPFSFGRRMASGQTKAGIYLKIAQRAIILWVLGMIVQGHLLEYDLNKLHLFSNTLQAIAVGYVVTGLLLLNVSVAWQVVSLAVLLVGYWLLMTWVPVPGHGRILNPEMNLAHYIDLRVLGRYNDGTHYTWLLSGMGFSATVLLGALAGQVLRSSRSTSGKIGLLAGMGIGCLALGWIWGYSFPINKHIWSSSMALWAAGWSLLLLVLFYAIIDVWGFRRWAFPLVVIGANAILAYAGPVFLNPGSISRALIGNLVPHMGRYGQPVSIFGALLATWFVLFYLYRKKTLIRV